jgi:glycosyltransferase involved in cell wall biosynthesis
MRVLITEFDLFKAVGGGQTVYRRVIETNPQIEFCYFGLEESATAPRPRNARMVRYRERYRRDFADIPCDTYPPAWTYQDFIQAGNFAASVAGEEFDVVELADFRDFGSMIRPAMAFHGVRVGRTALAMHGRLSTSLTMDWASQGSIDRTLALRENVQFRVADVRYGISRRYLEQWRAEVDLPAHYLHPLRFLKLPRPVLCPSSSEPPSIHFIGRTEKLKGPDIFVEIARWLPRTSYREAAIIGPESFCGCGPGASHYLREMLGNRPDRAEIRPAMNAAELADLFTRRTLIFVPSRYDTLNLVALESLFSGCPTVIGSGAGVCSFLRENFPRVPFLTLDIANMYGCLPEIRATLGDYDGCRRRLVAALEEAKPEITGPGLEEIYRSDPCPDAGLQRQMAKWYLRLMRIYEAASRPSGSRLKWAAVKAAKALVPRRARSTLRDLRRRVRTRIELVPETLRKWMLRSVLRGDAVISYQGTKAYRLASTYWSLLSLPERSVYDLDRKIQKLWSLAEEQRVDRARIWAEIARLDRMRGNELTAAAYELRVIRALGRDRLGLLPAVVATLQKCGFPREAQTAQAMFGSRQTKVKDCLGLLEDASARHRVNHCGPWEKIDDRRTSASPRVAVIVSLYRAADKLSFFLHALRNQTLVRHGQVEVILVDSGSPTREYDVFNATAPSLGLSVVYARSAQRETIQSAWNRGIALSRAPYLAFLGVDETVLPEALEMLAAELDADPSLDWVQGNSLVTSVDRHGTWNRDVMTYYRDGYHPSLVYLDTCYLSWVGALYRRSIHDRFGYYDASFHAAGDTEFKNRVLPFLKAKSLPRTLGLFWNYPGERTTESPHAEIEDLRAWYLHRTQAGVQYAFAQHDPQEALDLFYRCLRYRKSFCKHQSTDLEYALQVAAYLKAKCSGMLAAELQRGMVRVLRAYRSLDWLPRISPFTPARQLVQVRRIAKAVQASQQGLLPHGVEPLYEIFNDNRYEQHNRTWRSAPIGANSNGHAH